MKKLIVLFILPLLSITESMALGCNIEYLFHLLLCRDMNVYDMGISCTDGTDGTYSITEIKEKSHSSLTMRRYGIEPQAFLAVDTTNHHYLFIVDKLSGRPYRIAGFAGNDIISLLDETNNGDIAQYNAISRDNACALWYEYLKSLDCSTIDIENILNSFYQYIFNILNEQT